jgi:site-specific recombinase XerD
MLTKIYPRVHARYSSLPVLGPHLAGFATWLHTQGYPRLAICRRLRAARRLAARLQRQRVRHLGTLTAAALRAYAPRVAQADSDGAAQHLLAPTPATPSQALVAAYAAHLTDVRGCAAGTVVQHTATARELLASLGYDQAPTCLRGLSAPRLDAFLTHLGPRRSRASLQHTVAHLRGFLRFLATRDLAPPGLAAGLDTPRVYRAERLPRALPWETVGALLRAIDRTTPMGRRDYAMLLLIATYGLRTCEVAALTLDDIAWRTGYLRVPRPKVGTPLPLPLTPEVASALHAYVRDGRPALPYRQVFLRVRAPAGPLKPTAVTEVFQRWVRQSGLAIAFQGPHCLRHALALHLLRQGTPLPVIGDLLGHRSAESTCVYLRLHVDDLRDVALDLPTAAPAEATP